MRTKEKTFKNQIEETASFITSLVWLLAFVLLPITAILGSFPAFIFVALMFAVWNMIARPLLSVILHGLPNRLQRIEYRIRRIGLASFGLAGLFLLVSMFWAANVAFLMTAAVWGAVIASLVLPRFMLRATRVDAVLPEEIYAGTPFVVEVTIRNARSIQSSYGLTIGPAGGSRGEAQHLPRLRGQETYRMLVRESLPQRGSHRIPPLTIATEYPFGLFLTRRYASDPRKVIVFPELGEIVAERMRRYRGGEARWLVDQRRKDQQGEFRSLRKYQPGDNPRHIHWPTSARMGEFYLREFERREMHSALFLLDAYRRPEDTSDMEGFDARFETAVSFTATLAAQFAERGVPFAFASYCPDMVFVRYDTGIRHLRDVLTTLALAETTDECAPSDLADAVREREMRAGGICLITAGPSNGSALGLSSAALHNTVIDVSSPEFDEIYRSQ